MADQVEIQIPKPRVNEGSAFPATAYFRTRATKAASTPTTVQYRVDCLTTGKQITDWTTVSAASSVSLTMTAAMNAIQDDANVKERKQLTVRADNGLATQVIGQGLWLVENIYGVR